MSTATACKSKEAITYDLQGLDGISQDTLEQHYKLYQGYVTNLNTLGEKIGEFIQTGKIGTPEYAELKRRLGFEANGVILHELYFSNLKANGGTLDASTPLYKALAEQYGSYENWEADFKGTGMMRGIGWAVLYQCSCTGKLINFWIGDHELGHPAGMNPILILDVWEHAYAVDYKPTGRKAYIDAFFKNINWQEAASRFKTV